MTAKDPGVVVGPTQLGKLFGKSAAWGRARLRQMWADEQTDGIKRVIRQGKEIYTTLAVVHREFPQGRDMALVRKLDEIEKDLDMLAERLNVALMENDKIRQRLAVAEAKLARVPWRA